MLRAPLDKLPICKPPHNRHLIFLIAMVALVSIPVTQLVAGMIPVIYTTITGEGEALVTGGTMSSGARNAVITGVVVEKSLLLIVPIIIAVYYGRPLSRKILGFTQLKLSSLLLYGFGGAALITVVVNGYAKMLSLASSSDKDLADANYGADGGRDFWLVFAIVAVAPAAEEVLFRGFLQRTARDYAARFMKSGLARWVGLAVTAFTFGTFHLGESQTPYLAVYIFFGFLCGYVYELTGDLRVPTLLHALNNGFVMATFHGVSLNFFSFWWIVISIILAVVFVQMTGRYFGDKDQKTGMEAKKPRVA